MIWFKLFFLCLQKWIMHTLCETQVLFLFHCLQITHTKML